MTIEIDTQMLWWIGVAVVGAIFTLLKVLAMMVIKGIYKKIEECQADLQEQIVTTRSIATRAHTRIDDALGYFMRKTTDKKQYVGGTAYEEG